MLLHITNKAVTELSTLKNEWNYIFVQFSPISERAMLCLDSPHFRQLAILVTRTCRWRVWGIGGMIPTGKAD
jgi:hypothetical protein